MKYNLPELQITYKVEKYDFPKISDSRMVHDVLMSFWDKDAMSYQEHFAMLLLNAANEVIGYKVISQGGMSSTVVDIKLIMGIAIKSLASSIILSHNHPSGNMKASRSDEKITDRVNKACKLMDIKLLDHLIVGECGYLSFADDGLIK